MSIITKREQEILAIIKNNPMISQQELASTLGLKRSSVSVHITNLMKKGYIRGKGYIVNEDKYVVVIGGSNIDIVGFPSKKLKLADSNPGVVNTSLGGVGRNIAENLGRLDVNVKLITAIGNDVYGKKIINETKSIGVNMDDILLIDNMTTSTYLSIMNDKGDMHIALSHMDIIEHLDINYVKQLDSLIKNSSCVVLDTNLKEDVLTYLLTTYQNTKFFVDTVSITKSQKITQLLPYIHTLKPNKLEAEMLLNTKLNSKKSIHEALDIFLNKGIKNIIISMGTNGLYFSSKDTRGFLPARNLKVVNATGAGDAFMSGLVYGYVNKLSLEDTCLFARASSELTLKSNSTISKKMSVSEINKTMKEQ